MIDAANIVIFQLDVLCSSTTLSAPSVPGQWPFQYIDLIYDPMISLLGVFVSQNLLQSPCHACTPVTLNQHPYGLSSSLNCDSMPVYIRHAKLRMPSLWYPKVVETPRPNI